MSPSSTHSNVSHNDRRFSDFNNYRRDLAVIDHPRGNNSVSNQSAASSQIAPWMSSSNSGPSRHANSLPLSFYNDSTDSLSVASQQMSPALPPSGSRAGQLSVSYDSPDAMYYNHDGRRPSAASVATTASSQGSKASAPRGGFRKLQGFFGEEFPGRDSSESSLPGSIGKDQRSRSYSNTRPNQERQYSNATDREPSPASSRPRTPVPAPEVVPFLYQDNTVSAPFKKETVTSKNKKKKTIKQEVSSFIPVLFVPHILALYSPEALNLPLAGTLRPDS